MRPTVVFHTAVGITLDMFVAPVSAALAAHGFRRVAVTGRGSVPAGADAHFDEIHEVHPFRRGGAPSLARAAAGLGRIVRSTRADLLHLHTPYAIALGRCVARATGTPHLAVVHGTLFDHPGPAGRLFSLVEYATARLTRDYVTVNGTDRDFYLRMSPGSRVHLAPCGGAGLDVGRLRGDAACTRVDRDRPPRVLVMGRLTPDKDLDLTVAAWRAARERVPGLELRIVGSAVAGERAWTPPVEPGLTAVPWTDRPGAELAGADVLLSTSPREGFPMNLVEALVLGTPVVAVTNRGSRAVAERAGAGAGITVVPGRAGAVADALVAAVRHRHRFETPAAAVTWTREAVVDFHVARVLEIIERGRGGAGRGTVTRRR